jgi:hypothetical protein
VILQFTAAHGASIDWVGKTEKLWERDSVFTAHVQQIFLDPQESAFLFPLEIADIVKKDGRYMLVADLSCNVYVPLYDIVLMLDCPQDIAESILDDETGSSFDTFLVAAKIDSVRNIAMELISEIDYEEYPGIEIDIDTIPGHVILVGECLAITNIGEVSSFDFEELAGVSQD